MFRRREALSRYDVSDGVSMTDVSSIVGMPGKLHGLPTEWVLNRLGGQEQGAACARGANPGTDSQFPANCAENRCQSRVCGVSRPTAPKTVKHPAPPCAFQRQLGRLAPPVWKSLPNGRGSDLESRRRQAEPRPSGAVKQCARTRALASMSHQCRQTTCPWWGRRFRLRTTLFPTFSRRSLQHFRPRWRGCEGGVNQSHVRVGLRKVTPHARRRGLVVFREQPQG